MQYINDHLKAIVYDNNELRVIDQLKLPNELVYIDIKTVEEAFSVIRCHLFMSSCLVIC